MMSPAHPSLAFFSLCGQYRMGLLRVLLFLVFLLLVLFTLSFLFLEKFLKCLGQYQCTRTLVSIVTGRDQMTIFLVLELTNVDMVNYVVFYSFKLIKTILIKIYSKMVVLHQCSIKQVMSNVSSMLRTKYLLNDLVS